MIHDIAPKEVMTMSMTIERSKLAGAAPSNADIPQVTYLNHENTVRAIASDTCWPFTQKNAKSV